MIALKINCSKIEKARLFEGKNGKYIDLMLFENKNGKDKFGNDGFVAHNVTKEERERGERGAIIGNWKRIERAKPQSQPENNGDDVPF